MASRLFFTVTNDLNFDQRMHRICNTLYKEGYDVTLVGRELKNSLPLSTQPFRQIRLKCRFTKGPFFYVEYNLKLFFYLLRQKMQGICAIDLDTILPIFFISEIKNVKRIYDAHELFCEMKEIVSRPGIYNIWKKIENFTVPKFKNGYTVNVPIANEFFKMYGVNYEVIRNVPEKKQASNLKRKPIIIYQGDVNEGRCFEQLIPAMKHVNFPLHIYGDGNFMQQAKALVKKYNVEDKVHFFGKVKPELLAAITPTATVGVNLIENNGKSYYLSLSNRFFDYIQAGLPQLCVNYPAYKEINDVYCVAEMIDDPDPKNIAEQLNKMFADDAGWQRLHQNALIAAQTLNWEKEKEILVNFYRKIFGE